MSEQCKQVEYFTNNDVFPPPRFAHRAADFDTPLPPPNNNNNADRWCSRSLPRSCM